MKRKYSSQALSLEELERNANEARAEWNIRRAAVRGYLEIVYDPEELQMSAFHEALSALADAGTRAIGASKERYKAQDRADAKAIKRLNKK